MFEHLLSGFFLYSFKGLFPLTYIHCHLSIPVFSDTVLSLILLQKDGKIEEDILIV